LEDKQGKNIFDYLFSGLLEREKKKLGKLIKEISQTKISLVHSENKTSSMKSKA
jgi:hypothetical protein